jgi:hypothetical protein
MFLCRSVFVYRTILSAMTVAIAFAAFASAGCSGPCEQLADQICACSANTPEENACIEQVRAAQREVTDAESQRCDTLLDSCTCDALEREDLSACGLAKDEP